MQRPGWLAVVAMGLASLGCGGSTTSDQRGPSGGGTTAGGGAGGAALGGSGGTTLPPGGSGGSPVPPRPIDGFGCPGTASPPEDPAGACAGVSFECELWPSDLHIVLERSDAMAEPFGAGSKWDFVREGLRQFGRSVSPNDAAAIHVFGKTAGVDPELDCDVPSYALPDVVLDDPNTADAALAVLDTRAPAGPTTSVPALQGAKHHVASSAPGRTQTVALITARPPNACNEDLASVFVQGSTRMYVIALGSELDAESVSVRAGTRPFVFTESDTPSALSLALQHLRRGGGSRTCDAAFEVPPPPAGTRFDYARSQLQIDGMTSALVDSLAACDSSPDGGFYFDDPAAPTKAMLCPCSCAAWRGCSGLSLLLFCAE